jgi:Icc protein
MKFAIINDMHVGPPDSGRYKGVERKLVKESERLVKQFVNKMNESEHPEFVINLGDMIEDVNDAEIDTKYFKKAIRLLAELKAPIYYMIGNHDVRTLTSEQIAELLGYERMYYSFDKDDYHFVSLSFEMTGDHRAGDIRAQLPDEQIKWLKSDLAKTSKPTIVFSHYGLADDDMVGNFWFERSPHLGHLANKREVRKIFEESSKVKGVFMAHQHWNRMFVHNQIPYFTVTSLVENFMNDGVASEAHTIVTLEADQVDVEVKGNDPAKFKYIYE